MASRRGCLRLLLVACLALQVAAYVVETGDTGLARDTASVQDEASRGTKGNSQLTSPVNVSPPGCALPPGAAARIQSYQSVVDTIIDYVTTGDFKGLVYRNLAEMIDAFGPRMTGTPELEAAIDWIIDKSRGEALDHVSAESLLVPRWHRSNESAWMLQPRVKQLNMMGLGGSVSTPPEGIEAPVLVVKSFEELRMQSAKATGRIVVFNSPWVNYFDAVKYRKHGASQAVKYGAVGALVKSITPFSIDSPHTGQQQYDTEAKIPVACITVEDASMMQRMQDKGQMITVKLKMHAKTSKNTTSRNTVLELRGTQKPNETVLVSAHIDAWDVGEGAMDDGGGVMVSWAAPVVLRRLGLRPRRTVRTVLWTAEEQGRIGSTDYFQRHKHDHHNFQLILESDSGTFTPQGISFSGTPEATCLLREVLRLLHRINATQVTSPMKGGPDIKVWQQLGVPTGGLLNDNERYFWYHHSHGDTLTVLDPDALDRCLALWTSVTYVMADMEDRLPHGCCC
ncbi:carboxypeptidase Q-like [Eriocheir sinensis]|uniref:carboxypeptidase Q-like n=1 Tax=Eriocheir sinensis TaxID=95602 RepID=UPI0021C5EBF2|nr:carboxypeptidase Q-like [Eriocheir sinensis]